MDGLLVVTVGALYVALIFFAMRWAWRGGRSGGGSRIKASAYALMAFLAIYLPVFWNHIPVVLAHRAMCDKDAGFTAFVSPQEWREANKARLESVKGMDLGAILSSEKLSNGVEVTRTFGGLMRSETKIDVFEAFNVPISRLELRRVDEQSGLTLATSIDYTRGEWEHAFKWLYRSSCRSMDSVLSMHELWRYDSQLQGEQE